MVIVGAIIVIGCVLGGFISHHGNVLVLVQPEEFLIIGGAAIGSLVISNSTAQIKHMIHAITHALKSKPTSKEAYLELFIVPL